MKDWAVAFVQAVLLVAAIVMCVKVALHVLR